MIQEIADALVQSWHNFATAFVLFVPRLVAATIIFAGGFLVALLARRIIHRLLAWLHFDRFSVRTGASDMLRLAELPTAEVLVAKIVFWIVWIGFIVSAVDTLQFKPFQGLVGEFFRFVPRFLVALLVLSLGFLVGNFLWRATLRSSVNAGLPGASVERRAEDSRHRYRSGHGSRAAGTRDDGGVDGVRHHVRSAHARTGDRI
jgi:hypothetical protein